MKVVMHADMNSYFASVEQQANPFLRGKPVAICSRLSRRACVIACSVEAKKLGVKTGFNLEEARELAPNIIALEVDPPKIKTTTERIFKIFADYTPQIEAYSIDEAFLDLTGFVKDFEEAKVLAQTIKDRIRAEVGEWLRCSIGISHTRWLAKFAGELQKPDGLTVLKREDLPRVYEPLPVDDAWGIANGWRLRLAVLGIRTLGQLLAYNPQELLRIFGKPGYILWCNIAGVDLEQVKPLDESSPKSVGHSYVFHKRSDDEQFVAGVLMKLCERMGRRLRKLKLEARKISVGWGYLEGGGWNSARLPGPVFDSYDLFNAAWRAFQEVWDRSTVTSLAVTSHDLSPTMGQTSIFVDRHKRQELSAALDRMNDRYGEYTVVRGRMWGTDKSAPERVGYRKTVPVEWRGEAVTAQEESS
jgi:DNA polymerase-4